MKILVLRLKKVLKNVSSLIVRKVLFHKRVWKVFVEGKVTKYWHSEISVHSIFKNVDTFLG